MKRFLKVLIGAIGDVFLTLILAMCLSLLMRSIGVEENTRAIILNFSCVIILVTLIKLEIR